MSRRITAAERAMMTPGVCTRCGVIVEAPDERNSAGQCTACHNAQYHERREAEKARIETEKAEGRAYWAERGISTGDKVRCVASSIFSPGGVLVYGVACVGKGGAYVMSGEQRGKLAPECWHKIKTA